MTLNRLASSTRTLEATCCQMRSAGCKAFYRWQALLCLVPPGDDKVSCCTLSDRQAVGVADGFCQDSCAAALKQQNVTSSSRQCGRTTIMSEITFYDEASDLNPATLVSATAQQAHRAVLVVRMHAALLQVARFMIRGALRRARFSAATTSSSNLFHIPRKPRPPAFKPPWTVSSWHLFCLPLRHPSKHRASLCDKENFFVAEIRRISMANRRPTSQSLGTEV